MAGSTNEIDIIQSFQIDGCNNVKAFIGDIGLSYTPTAFNVEYEPITWTLESFGGDIQNAVINSITGEITYDAATVLTNNGNANFLVTATDVLGTKVTKNFCFKISDPILSISLACNGDLQEYRNDIVQKLVLFAKAESGYLFQDLAKTIPAINDGDPVFVVENSTGLGDIVAENGTPKLAIDNVDVGLNSIEFDGFSNLQYQPLTVPSQGDAFKLVFLAKVDATNNFATFISGTDATLGQDAILKSGTWQLANYNGFLSLRSGIDTGFTSITLGNYAGTAYANSITPWQDVNNGQYHLFAADYDGTNFKLYFNGQLVLDVVPISDFYGSSINLFRNINQAAYLKGHLAEFIYGDNTMTYADFIDTQAYFICKYGLDASLLAYASPFAVDLDNCYETVSQFEYQKLSNGTEVIYDSKNNSYYTLSNVPTPGLGLLKTPSCNQSSQTISPINGTSLINNSIGLGGTLIQDTIIEQDDFNYQIIDTPKGSNYSLNNGFQTFSTNDTINSLTLTDAPFTSDLFISNVDLSLVNVNGNKAINLDVANGAITDSVTMNAANADFTQSATFRKFDNPSIDNVTTGEDSYYTNNGLGGSIIEREVVGVGSVGTNKDIGNTENDFIRLQAEVETTNADPFYKIIASKTIPTGSTVNEFQVKKDSISSTAYPNTRDDSSITPPINFLYTDLQGAHKSAPISLLSSKEETVFYNGTNILKNNNVMQAIPALSFDVVPGWYRVKFYPFYNSVSTATGAGFNLGSGTAVRVNQTLVVEIHTTATARQQYNYSSLAQNYSNTASPRTTDNRAYIEAHFQVTTAGTIIPMFRSENTGLITLRAGTYLTYEKIG